MSLLIPVASLPFVIMNIASQPYQRGIFCQDESIGYPVRTDTITHVTLAAVTITCTIIIVSPSFIHLHHPSHDLIIPSHMLILNKVSVHDSAQKRV